MTGSGAISPQSMIAAVAIVAAGLIGLLAIEGGAVALALPLGLASVAILFWRPVIGLFVLTALIPVEAALMIGGRSAAALIGMAVFGVWGAQKLMRREPLLPLVTSGLIQVALVLLALGCLSIAWAQSPEGMQRRLILVFQLMLLSVLVLDLTSSWARAVGVAKCLVLAGTVAALLTAEQYFVGGARRAGAGVAGEINRTAVTLVTILPFAFFLWRSREATPWRMLGLLYIGVSAIGVAATLSRMNFLLFPLVVGVHLALMVRNRGERRLVFFLGAIALVAMPFMPWDAVRTRAATIVPYLFGTVGVELVSEEEYSPVYTPRSYFMRMGVEMFKDRPVLGSGFDNFQAQTHLYQWDVPRSPYDWVPEGRSPHSSHVAMLVGLGIVGFGLWIGLFVAALHYVRVTWRMGDDPRSPQILLAQAVGIAVVLQLFYGFYAEIHLDKIVWVILGLAAALHRLALTQRTNSEQDLPPVVRWRDDYSVDGVRPSAPAFGPRRPSRRPRPYEIGPSR